VLFERLEALAGCVKSGIDGGLEAAHCFDFECGGAVPAAYDALVLVDGDPRTLGKLMRAAAGAGEAGVYGAGHGDTWAATMASWRACAHAFSCARVAGVTRFTLLSPYTLRSTPAGALSTTLYDPNSWARMAMRVVMWLLGLLVCRVSGRRLVERLAPFKGNNEGGFWVRWFVVESIEMGAS